MPFWESERAYQAHKARECADWERHLQGVRRRYPVWHDNLYLGKAVWMRSDYDERGSRALILYIKEGRNHPRDGQPEYLLQTRDGGEVFIRKKYQERAGWFREKDLKMVPESLDRPPRYERGVPPPYQGRS